MSEISTDAYKGVRDFYPQEWATLQAIFSVLRNTLARYGYEEYNASPLERSELYESKGNDEIVREQTYTFEDRGGRRVTLRPEMTPTLARMVAGKRREFALPLRWFSLPNVFRYERPQRGRLREHYQLNVDLLGVKGVPADTEVITIAHALLTAFGAKDQDFVIRVSSRTLLEAACQATGMSAEARQAYMRLLDRSSKMPIEEFKTSLAAIASTDPMHLIETNDERISKEKEELTALITACKARGVSNIVFDGTIVRGFEYYTGVVFEIFDTSSENPRALFGGGRYDGLVALFGGDPIPAVGFGMGDVTLSDFLTVHDLLPKSASAPELFLGTPTEEDLPRAQKVADALRNEGVRVFLNLSKRSLGEQIKEAVKRGIPYFAAVGEEESRTHILRVKQLSSGTERPLSSADIAQYIRTA